MKNRDTLGEIADSMDSLVHAMKLPMPAQFHLDSLKATLPALVKQLRDLYVAETGENPWEDHP
jgi:hypothetical protein